MVAKDIAVIELLLGRKCMADLMILGHIVSDNQKWSKMLGQKQMNDKTIRL